MVILGLKNVGDKTFSPRTKVTISMQGLCLPSTFSLSGLKPGELQNFTIDESHRINMPSRSMILT